jgi:N-acetylmuramoyl-L-alanine amidase
LSLTGVPAQKNFTVVIDPGHGGKDPGCAGFMMKEKNVNLAVAMRLGALIEQNHSDVQVVYTRKTDVFIPLDERANIANRHRADLFISIHANSVRRGNASGTETYTLGLTGSAENLEVAMRENSVILMEDDYLRKYEGFDPRSSESYIIFEFIQNKHMSQSLAFASGIQQSFVKSKRHSRGVRQAGLLVLRKTGMPAVLIELGFISNPAEERFMASTDGQRTLAQAIYRAFDRYKSDYDRRSGNGTDEQTALRDVPDTAPAPETARHGRTEDGTVYKVQILTSDRKLSLNDKRFKGYGNISFYIEKGVYKYTCGATYDYGQILTLHKKAAKDFKGAFIIRMKNGKRIYN